MMRAALQAARTIGHQAALRWRAAELLPGDHVLSDEHLDASCAEVASTHHHPWGTCALGLENEAVVNPDPCVRGLDDVFVVDASVFPTLTSGPSMQRWSRWRSTGPADFQTKLSTRKVMGAVYS